MGRMTCTYARATCPITLNLYISELEFQLRPSSSSLATNALISDIKHQQSVTSNIMKSSPARENGENNIKLLRGAN